MIFFVFGPLWFVIVVMILFAGLANKQVGKALLACFVLSGVGLGLIVAAMLIQGAITGVSQFAEPDEQRAQILTHALNKKGDTSIELYCPYFDRPVTSWINIVRKNNKVQVGTKPYTSYKGWEYQTITNKTFEQVVNDYLSYQSKKGECPDYIVRWF